MLEAPEQNEGCLLGVLAGDRIGALCEGLTPAVVAARHGAAEDLIEARPGTYGSSTEMTAAVAEGLVAAPEFDGADMARRLSEGAQRGRGYGQATWTAIERLRRGVDWQEAGAGGGGRSSYGNGAATRSAPVGLLFGADVDVLRWTAEEIAAITHQHSLGAEGAAMQAFAVAIAAGSHGRQISPAGFLISVGREASLREYRVRYEEAARMTEREPDARRVIDKLGNGETALGSVVTAAYCFARFSDDLPAAVAAAASLGGNARSLASMTGARCGAHLGSRAVPERWLDGPDDVRAMVTRLRAAASGLGQAARRLE